MEAIAKIDIVPQDTTTGIATIIEETEILTIADTPADATEAGTATTSVIAEVVANMMTKIDATATMTIVDDETIVVHATTNMDTSMAADGQEKMPVNAEAEVGTRKEGPPKGGALLLKGPCPCLRGAEKRLAGMCTPRDMNSTRLCKRSRLVRSQTHTFPSNTDCSFRTVQLTRSESHSDPSHLVNCGLTSPYACSHIWYGHGYQP